MNQAKADLRARLKKARLELTNAEHTLKSRAIVEKLRTVTDWSVVDSVHFFEPLFEMLEPDINEFVSYLEDSYPRLLLFTPRYIDRSWQLVAARGGETPRTFDVIIVPMLGFDSALHRLGYGGGYYDKFLYTQPDSVKIGVCFELGLIDQIPNEKHDIRLDKIITESQVYDTP